MSAVVEPTVACGRWHEAELVFHPVVHLDNPYVEGGFEADFVHEEGVVLRRPAFWDGANTWRIRFAPTLEGRWDWTVRARAPLDEVDGRSGTIECVATDETTETAFRRHGFWRMSAGGRSLVHADGTPAILVADTAWAMPWRATHEQVVTYADDRSAKGFNAVLLMSVQPDLHTVGPRDRTADEGFDVGFEDLPEGQLKQLDAGYFQYLDGISATLADRGIAAVLQPVFQGFGWKGPPVAGNVVSPEDYARYCRYLVARYGARPAIHLVGADGTGQEPQCEAGGREVSGWDCYEQPTGLHYQPHAVADAHQDAEWLDFQWCQTGHGGEHVPERVADLARNRPVKAVANGEPTYERTGGPERAAGWWQGHEAWCNLFAGGTMGVVYGAASLWQWRLHPDEPGHSVSFADPQSGWREALDFEGSTYVGLVGKILGRLPTTDMVPDRTVAISPRVLRAPSGLVLAYQENGGPLDLRAPDVPLRYVVVDPRTGRIVEAGVRSSTDEPVPDSSTEPRIYLCGDDVHLAVHP
ncbi:MAG: DUF4038 domain-containing protein [Ornithinibacter sp.]